VEFTETLGKVIHSPTFRLAAQHTLARRAILLQPAASATQVVVHAQIGEGALEVVHELL